MMKIIKKINILLSGLTFLMVGCTADDLLENLDPDKPQVENGEMVDVTVNVSLDDLINKGTRAGDELYCNGDRVDMLVYAVRDTLGNVLTQYGNGVDPSFLNYKGTGKPVPALSAIGYDVNADDHRQTILNISDRKKEDGKIEINLRVMRGTVFNLSLWAQSSECSAYNFKDLTDIRVNYGEFNFSEDTDIYDPDIYDAYSASSDFSVGKVNTAISVTLTRALAQINLGISDEATYNGNLSDYENIEIGFQNLPTRLDIVNNKVKNEDLMSPTFSWPLKLGNQTKTFDVNIKSEVGSESTTQAYKYMGLCYILVPNSIKGAPVTLSDVVISVTKNKTVFSHKPKELSVDRNWRTNILFSRYKYLTPPEKPDVLPKPVQFGSDGDGLEVPNSVKWDPFVESYSVGLKALEGSSGQATLDDASYLYEVTYLASEKAKAMPLPVSRTTSVEEPFTVVVPAYAMYALSEKGQNEYPKLEIRAVSQNKDFYEDSDPAEIEMSVNWDKNTIYTWNFSGDTNTYGIDNLNGRAFYNYGHGLTSDGNDIANILFGGEEYFGLYYEAMQNSGRSWSFISDNIYGGGGITTNLHFKVNSSCNIQIKGKNPGNDSRNFIIDYGVSGYEGDQKDGFMLPPDITKQESNVWDEREGYAIIQAPKSLEITIPPYFLDYAKIRTVDCDKFNDTKGLVPNEEDMESWNIRAGNVYVYFFGGKLNLYAISLSYPGSD